MGARIWYYAKVLDNQDPLNLGRIRANLLTDDELNQLIKKLTNKNIRDIYHAN